MSVRLVIAVAAGAAFAIPALAGVEHQQVIREQCHAQLQLSDSVCDCMANAAATTLNETQQAFTAARVSNNMAVANSLQSQLSADEAMGVMNYMTSYGGCR